MFFRRITKGVALLALTLLLVIGFGRAAFAGKTLRVVMYADLKILDPIWTTAYLTRNYGYMVYDTLFAMDAKFAVRPQMVDKYTLSDDKLTYTFTLRDGLLWHDGAPVKAEDAVASIKRWGSKDIMGQKLMSFTKELKAVDDKTFKLILKEPYGLVLMSMAKPSSTPLFIMPKRIAETPANKQISEYIGSGPFIFKADEWKPGDKVVFAKFRDYKPRNEPPSWAAGGKVAKVDRVEWISMPDHQTAINALIAGEIDFMERPPIQLLPLLKAESDRIAVVNTNKLGTQYILRLNHLYPPFNNVKLRRAALAAIQQEDFLKAVIGDPEYYKVCPAMFMCGTPLATDAGAGIVMKSDFKLAKKLLKEGGYDGTPVVIMQATDVQLFKNLAPVAAQALKRAGFKVDLQAMDWQTLVARRAKKDPPSKGGWNVFMTSFVGADCLDPLRCPPFNASCGKAWFGWPCDKKMEELRDAFSRETDPEKQKKLAEEVQMRAMEIVTHAHIGQYYNPSAWRKDRIEGVLEGPVPYFWNISKK